MSEDYTYERVEVVAIRRDELAALQQRVVELEAQLAQVDSYASYYRYAWAAWNIGASVPLEFSAWLNRGKPALSLP